MPPSWLYQDLPVSLHIVKHPASMGCFLVGGLRFELRSGGLKDHCSTVELTTEILWA